MSHLAWRESMGRQANAGISSLYTAVRTEVQLNLRVNTIQNLDSEELLKLQSRLGMGSTWGVIEISESLVPPGVCSANGTRILDMRLAKKCKSIDPEQEELGILTLTRYAMVCSLVPVMGPRTRAVCLAPTTISSCIKKLSLLVELALQKPSDGAGGVLSRLDASDLLGAGIGRKHLTELNRLLQFRNRGYWSDVPTVSAAEALSIAGNALTGTSATVRGQAESGDEQPDGVENEAESIDDEPRQFQPFSDEYVAETGWRVAWMVEHLGLQLIKCAEALVAIYGPLKSTSEKFHALECKRSWAASKFLASYDWLDTKGEPLAELPFDIRFTGQGKGTGFCWPPKTHSELKGLLTLLLASNLHISLFSTGGRISEILSFQQGCIVEAADGSMTVAGRTYKLVTIRGGQERDWPIPAIGVLAIYLQERLAKVSGAINLNDGRDEPRTEGAPLDSEAAHVKAAPDADVVIDEFITDPIWLRVGAGLRIKGDYNLMLISAIEVLGLTELAGGVNPHAHRYRVTLARLLALALADAPKILMDLFGHKTIEMTLRYILADPVIRAEMQKVLQAQTIMLAEEAIHSIDEYGGPAAAKVKEAVDDLKTRRGSDYGATDIKDLAETFTLSGKFWTLVRPGVICTKLPQQVGPCNKRAGMPEPSKCRSHCEVRLETAALRDDVDRSIERAFQFLEEEKRKDNPIGVELWLGQVQANINRFPALRQKWEDKLAEVQAQLADWAPT